MRQPNVRSRRSRASPEGGASCSEAHSAQRHLINAQLVALLTDLGARVRETEARDLFDSSLGQNVMDRITRLRERIIHASLGQVVAPSAVACGGLGIHGTCHS